MASADAGPRASAIRGSTTSVRSSSRTAKRRRLRVCLVAQLSRCHAGTALTVLVRISNRSVRETPALIKVEFVAVEASVFVCQACDETKGGVTIDDHLESHTLVRCTEAGKDVDQARTAEDRLTSVEGQLVVLTTQMDRIEKVLQSLAGARSV